MYLFHTFSIEQVTERMRKTCDKCNRLPIGIRLKRTTISLNRFHTDTYCHTCGINALEEEQGMLRNEIDKITGLVTELSTTDKSGC